MKHAKLWISLVGLALVVGGFSAYTLLAPGPAANAVEVRSGTLRSYVEERARTSLPRIATLTMPFDGRLEPISVEPGTQVAAGEVLARVASEDLRGEVEIAGAEVARIEAQLAVLADDALERTAQQELLGWIEAVAKLEQSAAALIQANEEHAAFADWWTEAEEKLRSQGAVAEEKYRRAKTERSEATVDLAVAKLNHQLVLVLQRIMGLGPKYVQQYLERKQLEAAVLEQERVAAQARLAEAERRLARAAIRAPSAGLVLERLFESERELPAGRVLLTLGDPAQLRVTADLLSDDAGRVQAGDAVDVFGPVFGELTLSGRVIRVDPKGFTKVSSLGVEQQRVAVVIGLDQGELGKLADAGLHLGVDYRVHVRVYTDTAEDALSVPRVALLRDGGGASGAGGWALYRVVDGKAVRTPVTLGIGNPHQVQVTKGLDAGDLVLVSPARTLTDGSKVTPQLPGGG